MINVLLGIIIGLAVAIFIAVIVRRDVAKEVMDKMYVSTSDEQVHIVDMVDPLDKVEL